MTGALIRRENLGIDLYKGETIKRYGGGGNGYL